jgi:dynein heavy chain 1
MRHSPLLLVDFPARDSLMQIYRTFNGGVLKLFPNLKPEVGALTEAMVELYIANQQQFTVDMQPQYFYSPRELSRWVRAIYEAAKELDGMSRGELVRLWAHEAMRLFSDRLVTEEERDWCSRKIDEIANNCWPGLEDSVLQRPILYSTWLQKKYTSVDVEDLRHFMAARLKVFYEEELDVPLVVFDEVLEHVLRIDRVLKQPMGHCLLVGDSGAGKTVLSKFVSWMNGLSIFQIKAHSKYTIDDFNEDLREVMKRVGVGGEKICFIFDESNALSSGFLEAMNALLASGEVPGLFEGDDLVALMNSCRENSLKEGGGADDDELWSKFVTSIQRNLHVVFTMNPSGDDFSNRSTTSPALFNRCVVDWFGTWGVTALGQVGKEFIASVDMGVGEQAWSGARGDGTRLLGNVESVFSAENVDEGATMRQAVVAALVNIHEKVKDVCDVNNKAAMCKNYVSPRDYLDLINNFVKVVREKRGNLEDQQLHIGAGLEKLRMTQEQVRVLEEGLGATEAVLREKEAMANNKLQQMIEDQNVAEVQKKEAVLMNEEVARQQEEIQRRQEEAESELGEAEPALISAQQSVRSIKKTQLDEIRALARPPDNVRMTLEAVAIMLGEKQLDWPDIRKMLQNREFIPNILEFDVNNLSDRQIQVVKENYVDGDVLSYEAVNRSSKACGPLYKWVASQIGYSVIFNRVQPLREEVAKLQSEAEEGVERKNEVEAEVAELESRIGGLKADYAELIRGVEMIKSEMSGVKLKVTRAESLLKSLMSESDRWEESSGGFEVGLICVIGDALISAGFLTYSGFFDHRVRGNLITGWKETLDNCGLNCRRDFEESTEFLSKAGERLEWESWGLGGDKLSTENAIILERGDRFPFIIDPSGVCSTFLVKKYEAEGLKVNRTSFLDGGFMKTLASSIRFGSVLLVSDVEALDPILNPVLNKELMRTGGRTMVRLGNEDVDFSPKFRLILTTRNGAVRLTPDLCSRVSLVNFTVTPASLQSQALGLLLKMEKPELEEKRALLLKVRGEQNVKLRELEEQLLEKISSVEGSILDDDELIRGMEVVKAEAGVVESAIKEGERTMSELVVAVGEFEDLSQLVSELYFVLEGFSKISAGFYQYSLRMYLDVVSLVVGRKVGQKVGGSKRLDELKGALVKEVVGRVSRGLFEEDKLVLGLKLCSLVGKEMAIGGEMDEMDDLMSKGVAWIQNTFGSDFEWQGRGLNELGKVCSDEVSAGTPVMLCSAPGYDVSGRVQALADEKGVVLKSIAMGSSEGYLGAEKLIVASAKEAGVWCMLKNIHLCSEEWLVSLEKKLYGMEFGEAGFRLFLTSEVGERVRDGEGGFKVPMTLLSMSDVCVCEAPTGLKNNVMRFFKSIGVARFQAKPVERGRLYLLVSWLYAVVLERLRYSPTGWSKRYEFSEADAINAVDVVDAWVDRVGGGDKKTRKAHVAPEDLPWSALRVLLSESVFGGRIDNSYDQSILNSFVSRLFVAESFDVGFEVVEGLKFSEGVSRDDFLNWIENLPADNSCVWLGLSSAAEKARMRLGGERISRKLIDLRGVEEGTVGGLSGRGRTGSTVEKLESVRLVAERWLGDCDKVKMKEEVKEEVNRVAHTNKDMDMNSLQRCFDREVKLGAELMRTVVGDLRAVVAYCKGLSKLSSHVKAAVDSIAVGAVPSAWGRLYEVVGGIGVSGDKWMADFVARNAQLKKLKGLHDDSDAVSMSTAVSVDSLNEAGGVWVGGLFNPGAFVTASRQYVAERLMCGIDELGLVLGGSGSGEGGGDEHAFVVTGMNVEGAKLKEGKEGGGFEVSDALIDSLGVCTLKWQKAGGTGGEKSSWMMLPIYLNSGNRKKIIVSVGVEGGDAKSKEELMLRGVACFLN